jgi:hypothetical protein
MRDEKLEIHTLTINPVSITNIINPISITSLTNLNTLPPLITIHNGFDDELPRLLTECLYRETRTYDKASSVINFLSIHHINIIDKSCHGLVYYPELLNRFLSFHRDHNIILSPEHITNMFQRCLEHTDDDVDIIQSVNLLLGYIGTNGHLIKLRLLTNTYDIDDYIYEEITKYGIRDVYYEYVRDNDLSNLSKDLSNDLSKDLSDLPPYTFDDVIKKKQNNETVSFRDINHTLSFGKKEHIQAIIIMWDIWGYDHTVNYASSFFGLSTNNLSTNNLSTNNLSTDLSLIKDYMNEYCNRL